MYENYYIRQIDSNPPPPAPSKKIVQTKSSFSKVKKSTIQKKKKNRIQKDRPGGSESDGGGLKKQGEEGWGWE